MQKLWHDEAWEEYLYWQTQDKKTLKKINRLIQDIERNGLTVPGNLNLLPEISQDFGAFALMKRTA